MKLAELIADEPHLRVQGDAGVEVAGLSYDSRRVKPGDVFFSLARIANRPAPISMMH